MRGFFIVVFIRKSVRVANVGWNKISDSRGLELEGTLKIWCLLWGTDGSLSLLDMREWDGS